MVNTKEEHGYSYCRTCVMETKKDMEKERQIEDDVSESTWGEQDRGLMGFPITRRLLPR